MELTKEISYDKNLIQNNNFTLKYTGQLFKDNSEELAAVQKEAEIYKNLYNQLLEKLIGTK